MGGFLLKSTILIKLYNKNHILVKIAILRQKQPIYHSSSTIYFHKKDESKGRNYCLNQCHFTK